MTKTKKRESGSAAVRQNKSMRRGRVRKTRNRQCAPCSRSRSGRSDPPWPRQSMLCHGKATRKQIGGYFEIFFDKFSAAAKKTTTRSAYFRRRRPADSSQSHAVCRVNVLFDRAGRRRVVDTGDQCHRCRSTGKATQSFISASVRSPARPPAPSPTGGSPHALHFERRSGSPWKTPARSPPPTWNSRGRSWRPSRSHPSAARVHGPTWTPDFRKRLIILVFRRNSSLRGTPPWAAAAFSRRFGRRRWGRAWWARGGRTTWTHLKSLVTSKISVGAREPVGAFGPRFTQIAPIHGKRGWWCS